MQQKIIARLHLAAEEIINYIKSNAPRSGKGNALADSFIKQVNGDGLDTIITIFSSSKGSIVHLIEFGFKHKSGVFVAARPFMRPAYDLVIPKMLEDINHIIKGE